MNRGVGIAGDRVAPSVVIMADETVFYFLLAAGYIAAHFLAYVLFLRHRPAFRQERVIFLYHFVPACIYFAFASLPMLISFDPSAVLTTVGLISGHGIYSLSFLELWSLADGSYSVSILIFAKAEGKLSPVAAVTRLARLGDAKKSDRLAALSRLGLSRHDGEVWALTGRGQIMASFLRSLLWLANLKNSG